MTEQLTPRELTAGELKADLTLEQLQRLVGLVEYDASSDPFPVTALDAVVARFAARGVAVEITGLDEHSARLHARLSAAEPAPTG